MKFNEAELTCVQDSWQQPDSLFSVIDGDNTHICCVVWDDPQYYHDPFVIEHYDTNLCQPEKECWWEGIYNTSLSSNFLVIHPEVVTACILWAKSGGFEMPLYQFLEMTLNGSTNEAQ